MFIQNRDCVHLGPPAEGDAVQVRWTDGLIYGAKFIASHSIPMYLVNLHVSVLSCILRRTLFVLTTSEDFMVFNV